MFCFPFKKCLLKSSTSTKTWGNNYIPKDATQQDIFLSEYPKYDGRGIKIAIIDSGFDLIEGLQQTSEGLPKIIDCFDFTGNGDVDTSVVREVDSKNFLTGLSGKKFKIPSKWKNPSGKWHLGLKALYKPTMSKVATDITQKLPELDCIVWHDGAKWCACIETFKDLKKAKVLTNFRDEHEYGTLCLDGLKLTYCVTIRNEGNSLEIFAPHDDHGSVVAQVVAAHCPRKPEKDGLAPGAQLLLKCIKYNVDIINCSFSSFYGDEKTADLIYRIVSQHNILIFKCAGNSGPFYSSVYKCDKNVEDVIFTIGAVLTPEMKKRIHNVQVVDNCPPVVYNFSSRGPGAKCSRGLDFVAPGAAITDKPRFHPEQNGGYAGTSYSCPNAAGAVACLLSALNDNKIQYSPKSIKFVLTKTAVLPENQNKFEFGHGIIQISDAFDYFCKNKTIDYNTEIPTPIAAAGGIECMINDDEGYKVVEREIDLSHYIEIGLGTAVEEKWTLEVSPKKSEYFIEILSQLDENNKFKIKVDTKNLEAGSSNFAEVVIMDPVIGSIFFIPVNVIYVLKITETHNFCIQKEITLNYENVHHLIIYSCYEEKSCNKCELTITGVESLTTQLCGQYVAHSQNKTGDTKKILKFDAKRQKHVYSFLFENKVIHEICIFQTIDSPPRGMFKLEINFKENML